MGNLPKPSYTVGGACGGSGWEGKVPLLLPPSQESAQKHEREVANSKSWVTMPWLHSWRSWLEFRGKIKPKISKALLGLASITLSMEQLFAFLVRGAQGGVFLSEFSVNRIQGPARLV